MMPDKLSGPVFQPPRPNNNCYWVIPGKLLAGEYPGNVGRHSTQEKISTYLDAGVTYFLNLTERFELRPYEQILQEEAERRGLQVTHRRMSIEDMHIPDQAHMLNILDAIDAALATGQTVYTHCWGGIGRTGTVIGCYLVRHGNSGNEALAELARLWQTVEKQSRHPESPQTERQMEFVKNWQEVGQSPARNL